MTAWGYGNDAAGDEAELLSVTLTPFEGELLDRLDRIGDALTGRNTALARLLDADPDDLGEAIKAGAAALGDAFPVLVDAFVPTALQSFAETVIEAALQHAAESADAGGVDGPPASRASQETGAAPTSP